MGQYSFVGQCQNLGYQFIQLQTLAPFFVALGQVISSLCLSFLSYITRKMMPSSQALCAEFLPACQELWAQTPGGSDVDIIAGLLFSPVYNTGGLTFSLL